MLLINEICNLFDCEVKDLERIFLNPLNRIKIISQFKGVWLRTTYNNRTGRRHCFKFDGLTVQDAKHVKAYNNFLGITVIQHMYARHRIKLKNHNLPCVIENTFNGDTRYYPIELLEIVYYPRTEEPITNYKNFSIRIIQKKLVLNFIPIIIHNTLFRNI